MPLRDQKADIPHQPGKLLQWGVANLIKLGEKIEKMVYNIKMMIVTAP